MNSQTLKKSAGFTLVEMMVVISIIGMLTGLLLVGVNAARKAAKRAGILLELQNIDVSLKELKNELGGAFPPNCLSIDSYGNTGTTTVLSDLKRFMKKTFPRHQEPDELLGRLVGASLSQTLEGGMRADEAIVFWLGGFSDDPRYPISGKGGPSFRTSPTPEVESLSDRNFKFTFDQTRLGPLDDTGYAKAASNVANQAGRWFQYQVTKPGGVNETREIHFWTYTPSGQTQPYLYFDTSRYPPITYNSSGNPTNGYDPISYEIVAIKQKDVSNPNRIQFANPKSFQILHSGIDDEWGNFWSNSDPALNLRGTQNSPQAPVLVFPDGPFTEELSDTLVNFSTKSLEDSEP